MEVSVSHGYESFDIVYFKIDLMIWAIFVVNGEILVVINQLNNSSTSS